MRLRGRSLRKFSLVAAERIGLAGSGCACDWAQVGCTADEDGVVRGGEMGLELGGGLLIRRPGGVLWGWLVDVGGVGVDWVVFASQSNCWRIARSV